MAVLTFALIDKISTKKSASVADLLLAPPKQHVEIASFDHRTLGHFMLQPGVVSYKLAPFVETETEKKKKKKVRALVDSPRGNIDATARRRDQKITMAL